MSHVQRVLVHGAPPLFRAAAVSVLASRSSRFALAAVVGTLVLSFNWGSRLLLTNDDSRFPVLARDILVNGHWLLPALPDRHWQSGSLRSRPGPPVRSASEQRYCPPCWRRSAWFS